MDWSLVGRRAAGFRGRKQPQLPPGRCDASASLKTTFVTRLSGDRGRERTSCPPALPLWVDLGPKPATHRENGSNLQPHCRSLSFKLKTSPGQGQGPAQLHTLPAVGTQREGRESSPCPRVSGLGLPVPLVPPQACAQSGTLLEATGGGLAASLTVGTPFHRGGN